MDENREPYSNTEISGIWEHYELSVMWRFFVKDITL